MKKRIVGYIIVVSIFLNACNSKIKNFDEEVLSKDAEIIKIDNLSSGECLDISPFIDTIKYVKLELTDNSMIGYIQKIAVYKDRIYVLDTQVSSLFVFDINGNFLFKIASIGEGPEEYIQLDLFNIDYENKQIILSDLMNNRVMRYDINGNFIQSKKFPFWVEGVAPSHNKGFAVYANFRNNKEKMNQEYNFLYLDSLMETQKTYMPYNSSIMKIRFTTPRTGTFYPFNEQFSFFTLYGNNIYRLGKDSLFLKYIFDFGEKSVDLNLVENEEGFKSYFDGIYYSIREVQETEELLSFSLSASDFPLAYQGYYNKISKNILYTATAFYFLGEDEQFDVLPIAAYDSWIISELNPVHLVSWREDVADKTFTNKWLQQKKEFVQDIDMDDNPVLMFYKLKEF